MSGMKQDILLPREVRRYIQAHKIDEAVTEALNNIVKSRPKDPVGFLADAFAKRCTSQPSLVALRPDFTTGESLLFDVVVAVRGVKARTHSFVFNRDLFAAADAAEAAEPVAASKSEKKAHKDDKKKKEASEEEPATSVPPCEVPTDSELRLVDFMEAFFERAFAGVCVDEFLGFQERSEGLAEAPILNPGDVLDVPRAVGMLTDALLVASAKSLDITCLQFLQQLVTKAGLPELASPRLAVVNDLEAWRNRWPYLASPIFRGGGPSAVRATTARLCVALTPFSTGAAEESGPLSICPALGWLASVVEASRAVAAEALKAMQGDKSMAALVAEGAPGYLPPGGFLQASRMAKKAAETVLTARGRACETSGVLLAAADELWLEEEGMYEAEAGKRLSLEQLVELYAEMAEEGWVQMIVQPFRQEDFTAGCELLHARRPELKLVLDFQNVDIEAAEPPLKGSPFSCGLHLTGAAPSMLQQYTQVAPLWQQAGGCVRFAFLDAADARSSSSAVDVAMACGVQTIFLASDISDLDVSAMSARSDDVLLCILYPQDDSLQGAQGAAEQDPCEN